MEAFIFFGGIAFVAGIIARSLFVTQRQPLLTQLIERQHALQHQRHAELNTPEHPLPIEQCLPKETAFQSGRLVMNWDEKGNPEFFLHIKVALPTTQPEQLPETVMGFHEHEDGYSFAEVHLNGTVVRTGDLTIPKHVDPADGAKKSDNYVYEMAHAMLTEAGTAYIGIEDTSYQKDEVSLDRQRNRAIFGRPSGRIRMTLETGG